MWERLRHWGRLTPEGLVNANMETLAGTTLYYSQTTSQQKSCSKTFCKTFNCKTFWNFFDLFQLDSVEPFGKSNLMQGVVIINCRDLKTIAGCRFFHPRPSNFPPADKQQQFFQEQRQLAPRAFQGRQEVPKIDHFDPGMVENLQVDVPEGKTVEEKTNLGWKLSGGHLQGW